MLKYQGFVEQYSEKYGGLAQKIADFMETREVSLLLGDDLYEYFGTKTGVSKTQFYVRRNAIIDFVEFTKHPDKDRIVNRISNVSQVQLAKRIDESSSTYKNLDELLDLLNQIVTERGLHSTDATPLQSMAILIWMNYDNIGIMEFKISDIDGLENFDDKYKEILKIYAGLKYYRALPSGRVQNLIRSDYLFRTANTDKLTVFDVKKIISKINSLVADKNKSFTRAIIERSAAFVEMHNKYKLDITPDIIREYFGQSKKTAEIEKLIVEYKKWAEQF
jgi:hypothetical protein